MSAPWTKYAEMARNNRSQWSEIGHVPVYTSGDAIAVLEELASYPVGEILGMQADWKSAIRWMLERVK